MKQNNNNSKVKRDLSKYSHLDPFLFLTALPKSPNYSLSEISYIETSLDYLKQAAQFLEERAGLEACSFLDTIIFCLEKVCGNENI